MGKGLNRYFAKEDMVVAEKNMEKYSMSLIIRDEQIKTTMRYYFVLLKLIIIIINNNSNVSEDVEKLEPLYIDKRNIKCCILEYSFACVCL